VEAWDRLGEIAVPTLLMIGELDLQYLKDNVAHAVAHLPDARLVELPGVAHLPQLEGDERMISELAAFVAALRQDGRPRPGAESDVRTADC
jgi:pimeloyl-ACP methyl ester carboxylesterase